MANRNGAALLEALIAGSLTCIVTTAGVGLLRTQTRVAEQATLRSERNDGTRAALLTLRAELAAIEPRADLRAAAPDSIAGRIFRGVAVVCGFRDSLVFARYRGLRLPDAAKDSAVQISVENTAAIHTIAEARVCRTSPDEQALALSMSVDAPIGSTWLIFESGTYQLNAHALRYRRGAESRQPITAEIIDVLRSAFIIQGDSVVRTIIVQLRDRSTQRDVRGAVRFANAP